MDNKITTYLEAGKYLDDLQMHKIKLGLEAMQTILSKLGSPEQKCPAVHVAGTNGKGSVCSMLRSIMTKAGYRVGLYTSPHLSSVRERFRLDDRFITEKEFTTLMERVRSGLDGKTITYFECATALAFSWFADCNCDLMIIETGMGGRLDATNVLTPVLSVITTISLDHEQYLGNTVAAVAYEKAGIIKAGVPLISGVLEQDSKSVIEQTCIERSAPLMTRSIDFTMVSGTGNCWQWQESSGPLQINDLPVKEGVTWQIENSAIAVAAAVSLRKSGFFIADEAIRAGLAQSRWPGRMEYLEVLSGTHNGRNSGDAAVLQRFLLDGAHNAAGVSQLIEALENNFSYDRLFLVWASMGDKTYAGMLRDIARHADYLLLTRADSERSATPEDLMLALGAGYCEKNLTCFDSVAEVLADLGSMVAEDDLVVVAGSLYLIGEFRKLLVGEVVE